MIKEHPFFEEEGLVSRGFELTNFNLDLIEGGWLRICADWDSKKDNTWKFKYPKFDGCWIMLGGQNDIEVRFYFPEFGKYNDAEEGEGKIMIPKASFSLGLYIPQDENENRVKNSYEYKYHQNTKYGVAVYFAPKDFESGNSTPLWDMGEDGKLHQIQK